MTVLSRIPLFEGVPEPQLDRLVKGAVTRDVSGGTEIFAQSDRADALFVIVGGDGHVRIGAMDERGKALMVEVFRAGDIFGEIGIIDGGVRTAGAVAEGRVQLLQISAAAFLQAWHETPAIGLNLSGILARRLRRTYELFQAATFETHESRLARQLLYLGALAGRRTDQGLRLAGRLRQPDLADLLGATTRTIITILNAWRADGLVIYDAEKALLTLVDEEGLRGLIDHTAAPAPRGKRSPGRTTP